MRLVGRGVRADCLVVPFMSRASHIRCSRGFSATGHEICALTHTHTHTPAEAPGGGAPLSDMLIDCQSTRTRATTTRGSRALFRNCTKGLTEIYNYMDSVWRPACV